MYDFPSVHDSAGGNITKLIYRDSTAHTNSGQARDAESNDLEAGGGMEGNLEGMKSRHRSVRRKRRVSTVLLLSGGPLANHTALGVPEIKAQDSMTSVERVTFLSL